MDEKIKEIIKAKKLIETAGFTVIPKANTYMIYGVVVVLIIIGLVSGFMIGFIFGKVG